MDEILYYDHVSIAYGRQTAVRDASFTLRKGEILGIVGESGCGKSTLIRAALGLLGPSGRITQGDIRYRGTSLLSLHRRQLRHICGAGIGMIFQNAGASFCPIRRIGDQLYESMRAHSPLPRKDFQEKAGLLLHKLGFENWERILSSYPFELSGGMQQRVAIASAMLLSPSVLLADEFTSALDVISQKQVVEETLLIRREFDTAMVIVTHNIGLVRAMADHVLVMKDGQIVEYGETFAVLSEPKEPYTKALMAAVPRLKRSGEAAFSGQSGPGADGRAAGNAFREEFNVGTALNR